MLMRTCDIQYLDPGEEPPPPAPTATDPALHAKLATAARSQRGRRFAFCELAETSDGSRARVVFQGIQANNGACFLYQVDQPVGWYTSIDAAYAHRGRDGMFLVWTEPPNPPHHSSANLEAADGDTSIWCVLLPFRAHGPHDARIRAIEIATAFEDTVPGLTREMAMLCDAQAGAVPITLFCPTPGCLREPYHHGKHQPAGETHDQDGVDDNTGSETPSRQATDHDRLTTSQPKDDGAGGETPRRQPTRHDSTPNSENDDAGSAAPSRLRHGDDECADDAASDARDGEADE